MANKKFIIIIERIEKTHASHPVEASTAMQAFDLIKQKVDIWNSNNRTNATYHISKVEEESD